MTKNENLLVTLMEECAELQQAVSKALRFGMDGCRPGSPERNNEHDIMVEYYQLVAVMEMLNNDNVLHKFSAADNKFYSNPIQHLCIFICHILYSNTSSGGHEHQRQPQSKQLWLSSSL